MRLHLPMEAYPRHLTMRHAGKTASALQCRRAGTAMTGKR